MKEHILVLSTVPEEKIGQKIARKLVEERLAACVTISGAGESFYWWKGKISKDKEHILYIKTRAELFSKLEEKILKLHPYEVPEIIALPLFKGSTKYSDWINKETQKIT